LHVAIEAVIEAQFDLRLDIGERHHLVPQRHPEAAVGGDVVVLAPLVDAHLLADHLDRRQRSIIDILPESSLSIDTAAS
jgi:hypothetical protein